MRQHKVRNFITPRTQAAILALLEYNFQNEWS